MKEAYGLLEAVLLQDREPENYLRICSRMDLRTDV